jgi:flagellar basal body-associated protein FliL
MKKQALLILVVGIIVVVVIAFLIISYFGNKTDKNVSDSTSSREAGAEQSESAVPLNADLFN